MRSVPRLLPRVAMVAAMALGFAAGSVGAASATACATVAPCIFGDNTRSTAASGIGADAAIAGESLNGDGVVGATTFGNTSSAAASGVSGYDMSTTGSSNIGVFGFSSRGTGLSGSTDSGIGVLASATANGIGVRASSGSGTAVGVSIVSGSGVTITALGTRGTHGLTLKVDGTGINVGEDFGGTLLASAGSHGYGATISSAGGDALDLQADSQYGITLGLGGHGSDGIVMLAPGVMSLDDGGNMVLAGGLTTYGSPASITRTATGADVRTYAMRAAEATIEDVGETTMSGGRAVVKLDPTFAATIDSRAPYHVLLTAEGENRGLYVTAKTARDFTIRESNGGTSTLDVQYRIVAQALDAASTTRLPSVDPSKLPYRDAAARDHVAASRAQSHFIRLRSL